MPTVKSLRVRPQGKAEFTRIAKMPVHSALVNGVVVCTYWLIAEQDVMELSIPRPESAPSGRRCAFVLSGKSCGFTGDVRFFSFLHLYLSSYVSACVLDHRGHVGVFYSQRGR